MALKANVFTQDFDELLRTVADYGHYQHFVQWQFKLAKQRVERSSAALDKQGINGFFMGNRQTVVNPFHDGEWVIRDAYGKRVSEGQDIFVVSREMEGRFNSFVLVAVYEALETYLKRVYARLLYQLRNQRPVADKKHFHSKRPQAKECEGQPRYFDLYMEYSCPRDPKRALETFAAELEMKRLVIRGLGGMTWEDRVTVFAVCRHLIVHNFGRVSAKSLVKLTKAQREYVESFIGESFHSKERVLLPTAEVIDRILQLAGTYGWALYILLSDRCGMADESELFRSKDGGKRKVHPK